MSTYADPSSWWQSLCRLFIPQRRRTVFANSAIGTYENRFTAESTSLLSEPYLCVRLTSNPQEVSLCEAADTPIGVAHDVVSTAGDRVAVSLLGCAQSTMIAVADGPIMQGSYLVPAAGGKVRMLPTSAGTYTLLGRALKGTLPGSPVTFDPIPAIPHTVS